MKIVEKSADRQARIRKDDLLKNYQKDVYDLKKAKDNFRRLKELSGESRRNHTTFLIDACLRIYRKLDNGGEYTYTTHSGAKIITNILTSVDKILELEKTAAEGNINKNKKLIGAYEKERTLIAKYFIELESSVRILFDETDILLSMLNVEISETKSFVLNIAQAIDDKIITPEEGNVFRLLNTVRNLLVHNLSSDIMKRLSLSDEMVMLKAVIIETEKLSYQLVLKYRNRIRFFGLAFGLSQNVTDVIDCPVENNSHTLSDAMIELLNNATNEDYELGINSNAKYWEVYNKLSLLI